MFYTKLETERFWYKTVPLLRANGKESILPSCLTYDKILSSCLNIKLFYISFIEVKYSAILKMLLWLIRIDQSFIISVLRNIGKIICTIIGNFENPKSINDLINSSQIKTYLIGSLQYEEHCKGHADSSPDCPSNSTLVTIVSWHYLRKILYTYKTEVLPQSSWSKFWARYFLLFPTSTNILLKQTASLFYYEWKNKLCQIKVVSTWMTEISSVFFFL